MTRTFPCAVLTTWAAFALPLASFGEELIDTALLGNRGVAWVGPVDASPAIFLARGVGDVDGDGLDDFAAGFLERPLETPLPYAVFLIYGRPRLSGDVPLVPELERTWQVRGREPTTDRYAHRAFDIAPAGDVEGDGYDDFFLGYERYPDNIPGGGRGLLVHGGPDLEGETTLEELLESGRFTVFRATDPRYAGVGRTPASIGDFNGDGEADIGITAPISRLDAGADVGLWPGAAFLLFSARDLPRDVDVARVGSTLPGVRIEGFVKFREETRDEQGILLSSIVPLGDLNGDGLSDVAVTVGTSPQPIFVVLGSRDPPSVLGLEDSSSDPSVIEIHGPAGRRANTHYGLVAAFGDVNGDGLADFGVSQYTGCCTSTAQSWVQVFFGSPTFPREIDFNALDPSLGVRLEAVQEWAGFGIRTASAGDFDGDGRPDLIIGSPGADPEELSVADRGEGYILFSRDGFAEPSVLRDPFPGLRILGARPQALLGHGVAPAGDFDGDGFDDVLVISRRGGHPEGPGEPRVYLIYGGPADPPLTLADVRPAFGPASGGKSVRLVGSGFTPEARVFFGGAEAPAVEFFSSSYLDVVTPPGSRGLADVSVTVGAETRTLESTFFYSPVLPLELEALGERGFTVRGPVGLGLGNEIGLGDFDGDGFDDAALSACWTPDAEIDGCFAVLVRGRRDPRDITIPDPSESATTIALPDALSPEPLRALYAGSPGDIDGDGLDDMFFSIDGGYGYIVFGRREWPPHVELAELFEAGGVIEVISPATRRMPVARLGDVDGDGIDDFALTVLPDPLLGGAADPQGEIVFVAGRRSWQTLIELPAQASGRILAGLEANLFGWEIVPAGDVNGDGLEDLLANSEPRREQPAYLIYGHPSLLAGGAVELSVLLADPERAISFVGFSPPGGNYSLLLSGAGDVNSDGFSDVLIGLPQVGGLWQGRSYVIFGARRLESLVLGEGIPTPPGVTVILGDGVTYANAGVGRCGDLDGDGFDDFVVRAPTGVPPNPGHLYMLSGMETFRPEIVLGRSGVESIRIDGGFPMSSVRDVLDSVGDFNGDGADDFVIRERGYEELPDEPGVPDLLKDLEPTGDRISIIFGLPGLPPGDTPFLRGETNGDGTVDLADPVFLLQNLFAGGERPACMKAADTNDDGGVDLSDGIFLLNSLFAGGGALPAPGGACGPDPTLDELSCDSAPFCG